MTPVLALVGGGGRLSAEREGATCGAGGGGKSCDNGGGGFVSGGGGGGKEFETGGGATFSCGGIPPKPIGNAAPKGGGGGGITPFAGKSKKSLLSDIRITNFNRCQSIRTDCQLNEHQDTHETTA